MRGARAWLLAKASIPFGHRARLAPRRAAKPDGALLSIRRAERVPGPARPGLPLCSHVLGRLVRFVRAPGLQLPRPTGTGSQPPAARSQPLLAQLNKGLLIDDHGLRQITIRDWPPAQRSKQPRLPSAGNAAPAGVDVFCCFRELGSVCGVKRAVSMHVNILKSPGRLLRACLNMNRENSSVQNCLGRSVFCLNAQPGLHSIEPGVPMCAHS